MPQQEEERCQQPAQKQKPATARIQEPAPEPDGSLDSSALTDCDETPPDPPESLPLASWLRQLQLPPKKEEDNYVISEHGSDSESEDPEQEREKISKPIPKWCDTYLESLNAQSDLDPDSIFGCKVAQCVLEDIFTEEMYQEVGKLRPKRQRGSSGDWRKDRLARHEVNDYKSRMGQVRSWELSPSNAAAAAEVLP